MSYRHTKHPVSPSIKDHAGVDTIMLDVLVALTPALLMGAYLFGVRALLLAAVSVMSCMGFEALYCKLMKRPNTIGDLSACVTGLLLAMSLPVTAPYWAPVLGGAFAIVVVKQFYGGLGKNFMNPALAGRMLLLSFPGMMTSWTEALVRPGLLNAADAVSAATPMAYLHVGKLPPYSLGQMLLGQHGGAMGEVAGAMLLLGGVYLLCRRVISWRIPVLFIGTVALLTGLFPPAGQQGLDWMAYNVFSGGLLLGAIFMATDYATSPVTPRGQMLFGVCCGGLTVVLRTFGSYPDGVGFSILTMNCCVWLLDRIGLPRRFGLPPMTESKLWLRRQLARLARLKPVLPKRGQANTTEKALDRLPRVAKQAAALCITIAVTVAGVWAVYGLTGQIIVENENQRMQQLLEQVMPQAQVLTETPYLAEDALSIMAGYNGNELIGHAVEVEVQGFGGMMTLVVGVNVNGEVTGISVTANSEHAVIGGMALERGFLDRYIGMSGTIRDTGWNSVDAVSGATDTSRAITAGVNKALYIISRLDASDIEFVDGDV